MWGSDLLTRESSAYIYKLCQYKKDEGETLSFNNFLSYNLRQLLRHRPHMIAVYDRRKYGSIISTIRYASAIGRDVRAIRI